MSNPVDTSKSQLVRVEDLHGRGRLELGQAFDFGVHGPVVEHMGLQVDKPLPLPVDYIVTAAWMRSAVEITWEAEIEER